MTVPQASLIKEELVYVEQVWPALSLGEAHTLADDIAIEAPQRRKVLVVDDERPLVETLRYNLERVGHVVCAAYDGREAIAVAQRERPDVILLDIMLPVLDGFSACAAIRSIMDVPIIMLTAKGTENDKIAGFKIGATDYICKPFALNDLMDRIQAWL